VSDAFRVVDLERKLDQARKQGAEEERERLKEALEQLAGRFESQAKARENLGHLASATTPSGVLRECARELRRGLVNPDVSEGRPTHVETSGQPMWIEDQRGDMALAVGYVLRTDEGIKLVVRDGESASLGEVEAAVQRARALDPPGEEEENSLFVTEDEAGNERRYRCSICDARFMAPLDDVPRPTERECDGCGRLLPTASEKT